MAIAQGLSSIAGPDMNGILAGMAHMTPQQLQQTAAMHSDNALIVSSAKFYSDQQKHYRDAQQAQMAPQGLPPVNQQAIASMAPSQPQPTSQQLPEGQGIAALPAPGLQKMAGGGIVAFDDGGEVEPTAGGVGMGDSGMFDYTKQPQGFARGGDTGEGFSPAFYSAANTTLGLEGGKTRDQGGFTNMGISKKAFPGMSEDEISKLTKNDVLRLYKKNYWDKIDGDALAAIDPAFATAAFDTAVNHGVTGASNMIDAADGDTSTLLGLRQQKYDSLVKADPDKYGKSAAGWKTRLNKLNSALTNMAPGSNAEAAQTPATPDLTKDPQYAEFLARAKAAQAERASNGTANIPGTIQKTPEQEANEALAYSQNRDKNRGFFEKIGDKLGISDPTQIEISNGLNALGGASGATHTPNYLGKGKGIFSGLASLGEKAYTALGGGKAEAAGLAAIKDAQAARLAQVAEAARPTQLAEEAAMSGALPGEVASIPAASAKAKAAAQVVEEAKAAQAANAGRELSAAEKLQQASLGREANDVRTTVNAGNAARTAAAANTTANAAGLPSLAAGAAAAQTPPAAGQAEEGALDSGGPHNMMPAVTPEVADKAAEVGAQTLQAQEAKAKGFSLSNQDLVMMGLSIMGGTSQYALENIGKGGLQGLAASRTQDLAAAKADYESKMGEKALSQAEWYQMRTEHPELFMNSNYGAGSKESQQQLKALTSQLKSEDDWLKSQAGTTAQIMQPEQYASRLRKREMIQKQMDQIASGGSEGGGTVAPAAAQQRVIKYGE